MFFAMNNAALALRVPLLVVLTSGLGINLPGREPALAGRAHA